MGVVRVHRLNARMSAAGSARVQLTRHVVKLDGPPGEPVDHQLAHLVKDILLLWCWTDYLLARSFQHLNSLLSAPIAGRCMVSAS